MDQYAHRNPLLYISLIFLLYWLTSCFKAQRFLEGNSKKTFPRMYCAWVISHIFAIFAVLSVQSNAQECGKPYVPPRASTGKKMGGSDSRIVGGQEAKPNSFPWLVSLQINGDHVCGGAIIRINEKQQSDIVVTASHCVYPDNFKQYVVVAGGHTLSKEENTQQVVSSFNNYNDNFNPNTMFNDIAVLLLDTPINFTETVQPICLPSPNEAVGDGSMGTVAGWGVLKESSGQGSSKLMQVSVPVVKGRECEHDYTTSRPPMDIDSNNQICAGYKNGRKDACQGDSGGPLMFKKGDGRFYIQGIVSFGEGCARPNKPGIYTRVSSYISWIKDRIETLSIVYKN